MDDDLIAKTYLDVEIALDALVENINLFLQERGVARQVDSAESLDWKQLWGEAQKEYGQKAIKEKTSETVFGGVSERIQQLTTIEADSWKLLQEKSGELSTETRRQEVRQRKRIKNHLDVTQKLINQLQAVWDALAAIVSGNYETPEQRTYNRLQELLSKTDLLGEYTRMWTIYERAWRQHDEASEEMKLAALAADITVDSLYQVFEDEQLRLKLGGLDLVAVFFESRLFTDVSGPPAPYIVAPYWGINLVWNWLAFGHEIGHHAYVNVGEESVTPEIGDFSLGSELSAHVISYLLTIPDKNIRQIWHRWLEEMCADLFCILFFGPVCVRSMQHMFFHLPPKGFKRFLQPPPHHWDWLLRADDDEHPIPYLRVYLGLEALQILEKFSPRAEKIQAERKALTERWTEFVKGVELRLYHHLAEDALSFEQMLQIGRNILHIMLTTPLYTLADKNDPRRNPRTLIGVFFDLDLDAVEKVYQQLNDITREKFYDSYPDQLISGQFNIRHTLAALQYEFERVTGKEAQMTPSQQELYLKKLSLDTVKMLNEYGERRLEQSLEIP